MRRGRWRFGHLYCRPNPRICMQEGLPTFSCPAHIVLTYISDAFCPRRRLFGEDALPLPSRLRAHPDERANSRPCGGYAWGRVRHAAKAPGSPHRERSRVHALTRVAQARRNSSSPRRPRSRARVPAYTINPARTMSLPQVTRSAVARDSPSNLAFAISLIPASAETRYHEIRTRTQEGGAHGSRRKALSRIAFPIVSHHR